MSMKIVASDLNSSNILLNSSSFYFFCCVKFESDFVVIAYFLEAFIIRYLH